MDIQEHTVTVYHVGEDTYPTLQAAQEAAEALIRPEEVTRYTVGSQTFPSLLGAQKHVLRGMCQYWANECISFDELYREFFKHFSGLE